MSHVNGVSVLKLAEAQAVALHEAVGYTPDLSCRWSEAVDLAWELWREAEGLFVAVGWVWVGVSGTFQALPWFLLAFVTYL